MTLTNWMDDARLMLQNIDANQYIGISRLLIVTSRISYVSSVQLCRLCDKVDKLEAALSLSSVGVARVQNSRTVLAKKRPRLDWIDMRPTEPLLKPPYYQNKKPKS